MADSYTYYDPFIGEYRSQPRRNSWRQGKIEEHDARQEELGPVFPQTEALPVRPQISSELERDAYGYTRPNPVQIDTAGLSSGNNYPPAESIGWTDRQAVRAANELARADVAAPRQRLGEDAFSTRPALSTGYWVTSGGRTTYARGLEGSRAAENGALQGLGEIAGNARPQIFEVRAGETDYTQRFRDAVPDTGSALYGRRPDVAATRVHDAMLAKGGNTIAETQAFARAQAAQAPDYSGGVAVGRRVGADERSRMDALQRQTMDASLSWAAREQAQKLLDAMQQAEARREDAASRPARTPWHTAGGAGNVIYNDETGETRVVDEPQKAEDEEFTIKNDALFYKGKPYKDNELAELLRRKNTLISARGKSLNETDIYKKLLEDEADVDRQIEERKKKLGLIPREPGAPGAPAAGGRTLWTPGSR